MHRTAYLLLMLATLFWGANVVAGKLAVGHVSPMLLAALRWGGALAVMLVLGGRRLAADRMAIRAHLPFLLGTGALGLGTFNVLVYLALNHTTAINVSILQAAIPVVVFAFNFAIFGIRLRLAQFLGFLVTVAGVLLIAGQGSLERLRALDVNFGDALMVTSVVLYGGYIVALRNLPKLHWQSTMIGMFAGAFAASAAFAVFEAMSGEGLLPDATGWMTALYAILFPSILAQILLIRGTALIGGNRAGLFLNLVPVFGTLMSIAVLSERFHAYHAAALVLVLGGIGLAERSRPKAAGGE
jgi:drug/metabolite transporter (DMT)-like permease